MRDGARTAASALAGAVGARTAVRSLVTRPPGGALRWQRTNYRAEPVTLLEGPALAAAAVAALVLPVTAPRVRAAGALATAAAAVLGAYDDLAGDGSSRGLGGHLAQLRAGQVTTGAVKVLGLAATGLLSAVVAQPPGRRRALLVAVDGAVVAGSANLVNLLDLRPGRALKCLLGCALLTRGDGRALAAVAGGAAAALLADDLAERSMLGDTGANAAGALLGVGLVSGCGPRTRVGLLVVLVALTLASERVSFTRVIEGTPVLRELDRLGRRPATLLTTPPTAPPTTPPTAPPTTPRPAP